MYRIAIVEDTQQDFVQLSEHIQRFQKERELEIEVVHFPNAIQFLQQYRGDFQVVMMDIDMPVLNGMDAARRLREIDPAVILVFVTALARFAVNGYEVNALDFFGQAHTISDFFRENGADIAEDLHRQPQKAADSLQRKGHSGV